MYIALSRLAKAIGLFLCYFSLSNAYSATFNLPPPDDALIGSISYISSKPGDTAASIGVRYNIGLNAILAANTGIPENSILPTGTRVKVVGEFLLPPLPRHGIVINLPEMRMYYYPEGSNEVMTFPIGIGRIGKTIPLANTAITRKIVNPSWYPPADIRKFNEDQGIQLPQVMPPGPDNPLGPYAIYLRIPTYLIHSTIFPESIGRRASFGCIRMNESDIKQFFPLVQAGTPVAIVDMPNKIAWVGNDLYFEAHEPLVERSGIDVASLDGVVQQIESRLPKGYVTLVDWQLVAYLADQPDGVPHKIGTRVG